MSSIRWQQPATTAAADAALARVDDLAGMLRSAPIDRNRDRFGREVLRELTGILEDAIGLEEAEGLVGLAGGRIGTRLDREYRAIAGVERLGREQVAAALVDLKRRIDGGFSVEHLDDDRIVLSNTRCPFGRDVEGREPLCMMTSNVFGRIAADNLGYARVELEETIARGADGCRVVVHLREGSGGREYFG